MKTTFTFKHLNSSDYIENYAQEGLDKAEKYAFKPLQARFIFSSEGHLKLAEIVITGESGRHVAIGQGENIFRAIDEALSKIERQLMKRKEKVQHHKKKQYREKVQEEFFSWDEEKQAA